VLAGKNECWHSPYDWRRKLCGDYFGIAKTGANFFGNPKTHPCKNQKGHPPRFWDSRGTVATSYIVIITSVRANYC